MTRYTRCWWRRWLVEESAHAGSRDGSLWRRAVAGVQDCMLVLYSHYVAHVAISAPLLPFSITFPIRVHFDIFESSQWYPVTLGTSQRRQSTRPLHSMAHKNPIPSMVPALCLSTRHAHTTSPTLLTAHRNLHGPRRAMCTLAWGMYNKRARQASIVLNGSQQSNNSSLRTTYGHARRWRRRCSHRLRPLRAIHGHNINLRARPKLRQHHEPLGRDLQSVPSILQKVQHRVQVRRGQQSRRYQGRD